MQSTMAHRRNTANLSAISGIDEWNRARILQLIEIILPWANRAALGSKKDKSVIFSVQMFLFEGAAFSDDELLSLQKTINKVARTGFGGVLEITPRVASEYAPGLRQIATRVPHYSYNAHQHLLENEEKKYARIRVNSMAVLRDLEKKLRVRKKSEATDTLFIFTLTQAGILSRRNLLPGDKQYSIEQNSRRHKVIKTLASSKSNKYIPTPDLAETVRCTESEFRKTCGELRRQISSHFGDVRGMDVIDSKGRSGYRINPKARIIPVP